MDCISCDKADLYPFFPSSTEICLLSLPFSSVALLHLSWGFSGTFWVHPQRAKSLSQSHTHSAVHRNYLLRCTEGRLEPNCALILDHLCLAAAALAPSPAPLRRMHTAAVCAHCTAQQNTAQPPSGNVYGKATGSQNRALCSRAVGTPSSEVTPPLYRMFKMM